MAVLGDKHTNVEEIDASAIGPADERSVANGPQVFRIIRVTIWVVPPQRLTALHRVIGRVLPAHRGTDGGT